MVKKLKIVSLLLVLSIGMSYAQSHNWVKNGNIPGRAQPSKKLIADSSLYKITYLSKFIVDTLNRDNVKTGMTVTLIGKNSAKFMDKYELDKELRKKELYATTNLTDIGVINQTNKIGNGKIFNEEILIEYPSKGNITYQEFINGSFKRYIDDAVQNWNLTSETKYILGFKCHKATCDFRGRKYEAWYTEEITFPYGPYYFRNLPGLIIELHDSKHQYEFSMIGLEETAEPIALELYDGSGKEILSREDFQFLKSYYAENPAHLIRDNASGITLKLSPERKAELEKRLNRPRPYNPIELE
ncbi:MAG: GLPGLI family protein [Duncaniella sp.]|nr:GLPGLI family protein [Muribaculum sp.]MCM1255233.1 GLPGLI family protein [Duncaniella sp.]